MYIELVKYPDVNLRIKSENVTFPLDDKTERLIKYMTRAMYQHNGIGLAAIQVGYHKNFCNGLHKICRQATGFYKSSGYKKV